MKIELIKLNENNIPDKVVVCFDVLCNVMFGYVRKGVDYFYCDYPYFHDVTLRDITHFVHIPNLFEAEEPTNPNQSMIDEYKERLVQLNKFKSSFLSEYEIGCDQTTNDLIEQFITKLEGMKFASKKYKPARPNLLTIDLDKDLI